MRTADQERRRSCYQPGLIFGTSVNAGRGTSADRPTQSIRLHIFLVAAVAGCPQLPDQPSELIQAFGVASFLGELRSGRGALVEIRKVHPEIRRSVRIGRRIAIGAWLPLIGSRR